MSQCQTCATNERIAAKLLADHVKLKTRVDALKEWLFRLPGEWLDDLEEDIEDRLSMLASIKPDLNADDVRSCSKEMDFEAIKNEVIEEDPLSLEPAKFSQEPRVPGNMISSKRPALHGDEKKYKRLKTMIAYSREKQSSLDSQDPAPIISQKESANLSQKQHYNLLGSSRHRVTSQSGGTSLPSQQHQQPQPVVKPNLVSLVGYVESAAESTTIPASSVFLQPRPAVAVTAANAQYSMVGYTTAFSPVLNNSFAPCFNSTNSTKTTASTAAAQATISSPSSSSTAAIASSVLPDYLKKYNSPASNQTMIAPKPSPESSIMITHSDGVDAGSSGRMKRKAPICKRCKKPTKGTGHKRHMSVFYCPYTEGISFDEWRLANEAADPTKGLKRSIFLCRHCKKPKNSETGHRILMKKWYCPYTEGKSYAEWSLAILEPKNYKCRTLAIKNQA